MDRAAWEKYIGAVGRAEQAAVDRMRSFLEANGYGSDAEDYGYALATGYGEAAAEAACEAYEYEAALAGVRIPPAEPAETAAYEETAEAMRSAYRDGADQVPDAVGRLVKRAAADTTLRNAARDRAEWAWVPNGDSCAFCRVLASNGWQPASRAAAEGSHAEHIHMHCDCEYAVRFNGKGGPAGYDPGRYKAEYDAAEGGGWREKMNAMRRADYAEDRDAILARQRAAYARRREQETLTNGAGGGIVGSGAISGALNPDGEKAALHAERYYESVRHMTNDVHRIAENTGIQEDIIQAVKNFVFLEKHDLGGNTPELFTPSYRMAQSWQRLIDGTNIQPHDLTLIRHEAMEQELMATGFTQAEAHMITSQIYNYGKEAAAFYDKANRNQQNE